METNSKKISWKGRLLSIQPRIRLLRSFDERSHNYMGYALFLAGAIDDKKREFSVGIGKAAQAKFQFQAGDMVRGNSYPVIDSPGELVAFYKTSRLEIIERTSDSPITPPPWFGVPPILEIYRSRGHRRLDARTYETKCRQCIWGCFMPVELTVDHWNPRNKRYRTETFCYGPKSCSFYKAGPTRKVPGRKGMTWEEEDWIDEEATSHRDMDD